MDVVKLGVEAREATGSNKIRHLRDAGRIPAVLYGDGRDTVKLSVEEREFNRHVREHHKVFVLAMGGKEQAIWLQEVQWDCLTDRALHIDFRRIDLDKKMQTTVEIVYVGHPKGISHGGVFVRDLTDVKIEALPASLPDHIELKVGDIDLGDSITAGDLNLPDDVALDCPAETLVCHMPLEAKPIPVEVEAPAADAPAEDAPAGDAPADKA